MEIFANDDGFHPPSPSNNDRHSCAIFGVEEMRKEGEQRVIADVDGDDVTG